MHDYYRYYLQKGSDVVVNNLQNFILDFVPLVSFEFFPPKTSELKEELWTSIEKLSKLNPEFLSITYGAGGSTRSNTKEIIEQLITEGNQSVASHLTCIGSTKAETDEIISEYKQMGIKHIVALRGDIASTHSSYNLSPDGYHYASELVTAIKRIHSECFISVAGYPEKHPEAESLEKDIEYLKHKVNCGANQIITQYFFDEEVFFRFIDKCLKAGINVPIIPGILPVTNFSRVIEFSKKCGTKVPKWMEDLFAGTENNPELRKMIAAIVAVEQVRVMAHSGIKQFHFYTLNRSELTTTICHLLRVRE